MDEPRSLRWVAAGSLIRPGPIGRLARLALGALCLFALWEIVRYADVATARPFSTLDARWPLLVVPLCLFDAVVNIGFSRDWGHRPLLVSGVVLALAATGALLVAGRLDSPILGLPLNLLLGYFYAHLGLSFVVAALIASPGCEMRAIPAWLGRIRGRPSAEHRCPAAFIDRIDAWEQRRRSNPVP
ncbi:MAG: hypothetical protein RIC56_00845 [Pseudomonadales bacterium]